MKILVEFDNQPVLEINVDDTETGRAYFDLCKKQNQIQPPFYRDTANYTPEYMIELAYKAKEAFNWSWLSDHYDISITAQLHKDLENYAGQLGFDQIPEQYDQLLYDLHHCLHAIQFGKTVSGRFDNFQIEWLTDKFIPLPKSFEFVEQTQYGDLLLINPYVGHNPLQIYRERDFSSLTTTCCFHNIVKPGIVLTNEEKISKDKILAEFIQQDPDFVKLHGQDKIRYYSGAAVIGRTTNINVLTQLKQFKGILKLKQVGFYE